MKNNMNWNLRYATENIDSWALSKGLSPEKVKACNTFGISHMAYAYAPHLPVGQMVDVKKAIDRAYDRGVFDFRSYAHNYNGKETIQDEQQTNYTICRQAGATHENCVDALNNNINLDDYLYPVRANASHSEAVAHFKAGRSLRDVYGTR